MTQRNNISEEIEPWVAIPSEHDVYKELEACTGVQFSPMYELFVNTMTRSDNAKLTLQLINKQCEEIAISEGDRYRRILNQVQEKRIFGEMADCFQRLRK